MTKDAIDQIFDRARHGDVFAQTLMGQILCEGKYVQQDRQNGIGWLRNAAQCNCLYARELINEYLTRNNYLPEQTEDNGGFIFTFHGVLYAVYYEADRMTIRYATTLEQTQISTMEALLKCRDNKTFAIDFWIQEYTNDNGESSYVLE